MPYATYSDLKARYDVRVISKYASDTAVPVPVAALASNPRVLAALQDASALITSACVKGNRYPANVLTALAADIDNGALLRQMTCSLAMAALMANRVSGVDEVEELVFGYKQATDNLDALRNGALIFNLPDTITASLPSASSGPSYPDRNRPTNWNPMFGRFEWRF